MEQHETYRSIEPAESQEVGAAPQKQGPASTFDITRVASIEPTPNGGWVAWSQVLGAHLMTFFVWGFITSFGNYAS